MICFSKEHIFVGKKKEDTSEYTFKEIKKESFQHFLIIILSFNADILRYNKSEKKKNQKFFFFFNGLKIMKDQTINNQDFILWNISTEEYRVLSFGWHILYVWCTGHLPKWIITFCLPDILLLFFLWDITLYYILFQNTVNDTVLKMLFFFCCSFFNHSNIHFFIECVP